ncbi:MAG: DEAD/DEAH box helicase [Sandaracinaceae bacterium]|nr:DEAD/DEAH box helicase [Sandaracinaceae bacterium]
MTPKVALSSDFLTAFARIPRSQQKKVRAFIEKFKADPTQASINYESLEGMRDDKVRTVRIDKAYRAVVIHPPQGDVYLCVWVDNHDEAMDWARRKVFEVNASTGSFQVWEPVEGANDAPKRDDSAARRRPTELQPAQAERLFSARTDHELLLVGVPAPLLPAVRAVRVEEDLDSLARFLPQEASDALYLLASGYDFAQALDELSAPAPKEVVDTADFTKALERPGSLRQFKVITDDRELAEMLDAPLSLWRVFLHPTQQQLVRMDSKGSARVLGGAGTGKTVVAMHRARHLALQKGFLQPGQRVLFTTYTKNLAADIKQNLATLCGAERDLIEVKHLHGWAADFLRARGAKMKVLPDTVERKLWAEVVALADETLPFREAFYREEWSKVVQAHDVLSEDEYMKVRRTGRGTPLKRAERRAVWKVLSAYRAKLDAGGYMDPADLIREARLLLQNAPGALPYRAVVADEVQDFRQADLALLRALVPQGDNDIFVVGDAHQRIYGHRASLGAADISIRGRRSRKLRINYRTTEEIRAWATAILSGMTVDDLDEGTDEHQGYHSLRFGAAPELRHFRTEAEEGAFIVDTIRRWQEDGTRLADVCVIARSVKALEQRYQPLLADAGFATQLIKTDADTQKEDGVRLAGMHRAKGLEFRRVILAGIQAGTMPLQLSDDRFADEAAKHAHEDSERRLLHVAATRARDGLVVTGFGEPSAVLRLLDQSSASVRT